MQSATQVNSVNIIPTFGGTAEKESVISQKTIIELHSKSYLVINFVIKLFNYYNLSTEWMHQIHLLSLIYDSPSYNVYESLIDDKDRINQLHHFLKAANIFNSI